jgi:hypothetical protein
MTELSDELQILSMEQGLDTVTRIGHADLVSTLTHGSIRRGEVGVGTTRDSLGEAAKFAQSRHARIRPGQAARRGGATARHSRSAPDTTGH